MRDVPQTIKSDHFSTGVWSATSAAPELRHYTCVACGNRTATWEKFKAHRAECLGYPTGNAPRTTLAEALSDLADLTQDRVA
jgi:hypothetical protein